MLTTTGDPEGVAERAGAARNRNAAPHSIISLAMRTSPSWHRPSWRESQVPGRIIRLWAAQALPAVPAVYPDGILADVRRRGIPVGTGGAGAGPDADDRGRGGGARDLRALRPA